MNADGSALQRLTNDPGQDTGASWSPAGTRIVYQFDRGRRVRFTRLWTVGSDGSRERLLSGHYGFRPTWSRDGSHILFSWSGLFTVGPDCSRLRRLPIRVPGELGFADWTD